MYVELLEDEILHSIALSEYMGNIIPSTQLLTSVRVLNIDEVQVKHPAAS